MIYHALNITVAKLNEYIKLKFNLREDQLALCNLIDQDGSLAPQDSTKLIASLVNIERETAMGVIPNISSTQNRKHTMTNAPVNLNIYMLITTISGGKNYPEALKFLSAVIEFFQINLVLNSKNTPQLNNNIDKLSYEIINLDFNQLNQLWGSIGGKYMPSVLYKMRMISIDQQQIKHESESTLSPEPKVNPHL